MKGSFNYGWNFIYAGPDKTGSEAFYPATGYRHRETGALGGIGVEGSSWSSSSYCAGSLYAGRLIFKSDLVYPLDYTYRAHGLSVRCVQN